MSINLLLPATNVQFKRGQLPSDKWVDVLDTRLSKEQQALVSEAKQALNINEPSTFCVGTSNSGERVIVRPKLVKDKDSVGLRWGKNTYPISQPITEYDIVDGAAYAVVEGYYISVSFADLSKVDPKSMTPTQKAFRALDKVEDKVKYASKLSLSKLSEVLRVAGTSFAKLKELEPGNYTITDYELVSSPFGNKYQLTMEDGRKLDGNTAIKEVCLAWDFEGVEVNAEHPAILVVGAQSTTKTGNIMVRVELYSHADMSLEPFDFGGDYEPPSDDDVTLDSIEPEDIFSDQEPMF